MTIHQRIEERVDRAAMVERRTQELLRDKEFDPFEVNNFRETVAEMDSEPLIDICERVRDLTNPAAFDMTVISLHVRSMAHWYPRAHKEAERQIDCEIADMCQRCAGAGCSSCNEDEWTEWDE